MERVALIRRCYQKALTRLRQTHDAEFQTLLVEEYEAAGLEVKKRTSRMASRQAGNTKKEGTP